MKRLLLLLPALCILFTGSIFAARLTNFPLVSDQKTPEAFGLLTDAGAATICVDDIDAKVVGITAGMLADDVERITGQRPTVLTTPSIKKCKSSCLVVAGTIGKSRLIDEAIASRLVSVDDVKGKWEAFVMTTATLPKTKQRVLIIAGSDRRGTAFGMTSLSRAMGVSPWYWLQEMLVLGKKE